jgi:1-acyl-sn-glycerol-3-phosphate acyltransferase
MSPTWDAADPPPLPRPTPAQRLRLVLRATALVAATYGLMPLVLLFNLTDGRLTRGAAQTVICLWGRICLRLCGVRLRRHGQPMPHAGAVVSNHAGWIDIFTHLAADRVHFVSKAEVARWPVVGILSRQIDPVYIERRRTGARLHEAQLRERLALGQRLCVFPEGTSSDGLRVLPFRSTLFAALITDGLADMWVQPVSLVYHPRPGLPASFYGWWGSMDFGPHVLAVLALSSGGIVDVVHHPALRVADFADRKALARACEQAVRDGMARHAGGAQPGR